MTKNEYIAYAKEHEDWAPGWDAIEESFAKVYPLQEAKHFGIDLEARAYLGGDEYLDGYSVYTSKDGYQHIVTFGMSELYVDEECFGGEFSKWGYEMTMKLKEEDVESCVWAMNMMGRFARYTFQNESWLEAGQFIMGSGEPIDGEDESTIVALMVVPDTEVEGRDTVNGRLDFLQFVGITKEEFEAVSNNPDLGDILVERMKADNPKLVTDMTRTKSYL
ncbi:MAG: suppressor of fused domain protein [Lachnospiraceae bacterium]|nr:suppressor of fused domain protein [Lachnospiraceae bacterium]